MRVPKLKTGGTANNDDSEVEQLEETEEITPASLNSNIFDDDFLVEIDIEDPPTGGEAVVENENNQQQISNNLTSKENITNAVTDDDTNHTEEIKRQLYIKKIMKSK